MKEFFSYRFLQHNESDSSSVFVREMLPQEDAASLRPEILSCRSEAAEIVCELLCGSYRTL